MHPGARPMWWLQMSSTDKDGTFLNWIITGDKWQLFWGQMWICVSVCEYLAVWCYKTTVHEIIDCIFYAKHLASIRVCFFFLPLCELYVLSLAFFIFTAFKHAIYSLSIFLFSTLILFSFTS
jgi:hypothetical protein